MMEQLWKQTLVTTWLYSCCFYVLKHDQALNSQWTEEVALPFYLFITSKNLSLKRKMKSRFLNNKLEFNTFLYTVLLTTRQLVFAWLYVCIIFTTKGFRQ